MSTNPLLSDLNELIQRRLLQSTAGQTMFCPCCGSILDCRRAVLVEDCHGTIIMCSPCYDQRAYLHDTAQMAALEMSGQLLLPGIDPPPQVEILDGREIRWPDDSEPLFGVYKFTHPDGKVEEFQSPDEATLEAWMMDSGCEALDGCELYETDATCRHGYPSWITALAEMA